MSTAYSCDRLLVCHCCRSYVNHSFTSQTPTLAGPPPWHTACIRSRANMRWRHVPCCSISCDCPWLWCGKGGKLPARGQARYRGQTDSTAVAAAIAWGRAAHFADRQLPCTGFPGCLCVHGGWRAAERREQTTLARLGGLRQAPAVELHSRVIRCPISAAASLEVPPCAVQPGSPTCWASHHASSAPDTLRTLGSAPIGAPGPALVITEPSLAPPPARPPRPHSRPARDAAGLVNRRPPPQRPPRSRHPTAAPAAPCCWASTSDSEPF